MKRFKNILVGVDLSVGDRYVSEDLSPQASEVVRRALWLARMNSAHVTFCFALDISARAKKLLEEEHAEGTVLEQASCELEKLVALAENEGVAADCRSLVGTSWIELIRQVLKENHDLVVIGTRHLGQLQSWLIGSTGIKLLRKCPCPVWVTQPQSGERIKSTLVAHDLQPVGDLAMELGCSMAQLQDSQLHILHATEYPELDYAFPAQVSSVDIESFRAKAEQHIAVQLEGFQLPHPAHLEIVTSPADRAILDYIERHKIDLLVMGTVARTGVPGFITGNTAEQLLPQIPCSVIAVKPFGFESPVTLE
ncbi:MAG: universal stress protein [Aeoliella sp.]